MASVAWRSLTWLIAIGVLIASVGTAQAGFIFSDFSNLSGLQLNGNATQSGNALRLTPATSYQSGSAFTTTSTPLGPGNSFSSYFQFQITKSGGIGDADGVGADGIVFAIQTVSNKVGGAGGSLGYGGISPSIGIEFDTYDNGTGFGDPNGNHVGLDLNGSVNSIKTANEPTRFNNGSVWNAWVDYDGTTNALEVRWSMSSVRPTASQLSATVNLQSILGQNTAFLGFTAGTGAGWGNQDILSWEYRDSYSPIGGASPVPAPPGIVMLATGLLVLGAFRVTGLRKGRHHDRCLIG